MRNRPLLLFLLFAACREPEPPPNEFEQHCMELVRDVLPDVHAVLGDSVGRQVSVREGAVEGLLGSLFRAHVAREAPALIRVDRASLERDWERRGIEDPAERERDLTLLLAHELAHVYQFNRHPWMVHRKRGWIEDGWSLSAVPAEGHATYVAHEVARRRRWTVPPAKPWMPSEALNRCRWGLRGIRVLNARSIDPYEDGAAYVGRLVEKLGRARAIAHLRKGAFSEGEVLGLGDSGAGERAIRRRLEQMMASTWQEVAASPVRPQVLRELLDQQGPAESTGPGWCVEASRAHDLFSSATFYLFPVRDARACVERARSAIPALRDAVDVFALESIACGDGVRFEVLSPFGSQAWTTETWWPNGDWLVVMEGTNLYGGPEWCEAWMRNVLRIVRGDPDGRFRAEGWLARWRAIWQRATTLSELDRGKLLFESLDDPAEPLRALAWANLPWHLIPYGEKDAFCSRLNDQTGRLVRMAAREHLFLVYDDAGAGDPGARALVSSLLHDPDPFLRSGLDDSYLPGLDVRDDWDWYWRFALSDPVAGLRSNALESMRLPAWPGAVVPEGWRRPVPGRESVEQCVAELLEEPQFRGAAMEFLVRAGSPDARLWPALVEKLREDELWFDSAHDGAQLLLRCPVPGGDRRAALEALAGDESEPVRRWAKQALDLLDE